MEELSGDEVGNGRAKQNRVKHDADGVKHPTVEGDRQVNGRHGGAATEDDFRFGS